MFAYELFLSSQLNITYFFQMRNKKYFIGFFHKLLISVSVFNIRSCLKMYTRFRFTVLLIWLTHDPFHLISFPKFKDSTE